MVRSLISVALLEMLTLYVGACYPPAYGNPQGNSTDPCLVEFKSALIRAPQIITEEMPPEARISYWIRQYQDGAVGRQERMLESLPATVEGPAMCYYDSLKSALRVTDQYIGFPSVTRLRRMLNQVMCEDADFAQKCKDNGMQAYLDVGDTNFGALDWNNAVIDAYIVAVDRLVGAGNQLSESPVFWMNIENTGRKTVIPYAVLFVSSREPFDDGRILGSTSYDGRVIVVVIEGIKWISEHAQDIVVTGGMTNDQAAAVRLLTHELGHMMGRSYGEDHHEWVCNGGVVLGDYVANRCAFQSFGWAVDVPQWPDKFCTCCWDRMGDGISSLNKSAVQ